MISNITEVYESGFVVLTAMFMKNKIFWDWRRVCGRGVPIACTVLVPSLAYSFTLMMEAKHRPKCR
jgi:hypothetical protein